MKTLTSIIAGLVFLIAGTIAAKANVQISSSFQKNQWSDVLGIAKSSNKSSRDNVKIVYLVQENKIGTLKQPTNPKPSISNYQKLKMWLSSKQREVTHQISGYIEQLHKTGEKSFAIALILASLVYGLVHAAGPGHGKVVISSYVLANHQTMRRGILLAFLAAFIQGTVAVGLVSILAILFGSTGSTIKSAGMVLTQASYILIIGLGLYFLYMSLKPAFAQSGDPLQSSDHHNHDHTCSHSHMPDASKLQGDWSLTKIISLTLSVGLRPCTGAVFVLVFSLVKGLFWAGILSVYAMSLGTAITISLVTISAVMGRDLVFISAKGKTSAIRFIYNAFAIGGSALIILFGILLFMSTLTPTRPF